MAKRRTPQKTAGPNRQDSVFGRVLTERQQGSESRQPLIRQLENALGLTVVTFFTSFRHSAVIADADADVIEDILRNSKENRGLALVISSRGGSGLAAERIINVCRAYSGTREFLAIVPGKAKSAATLICLGASRIMMGPSSELGPVDPQIVYSDQDGNEQQFAAHSIVASYEQLFNDAVNTKGNLEPYSNSKDMTHAKFKSSKTRLTCRTICP